MRVKVRVTHAMPIESQFQAALVDHLNAEVGGRVRVSVSVSVC